MHPREATECSVCGWWERLPPMTTAGQQQPAGWRCGGGKPRLAWMSAGGGIPDLPHTCPALTRPQEGQWRQVWVGAGYDREQKLQIKDPTALGDWG
jgi:hypothetical protein